MKRKPAERARSRVADVELRRAREIPAAEVSEVSNSLEEPVSGATLCEHVSLSLGNT